MDLLIILLDPPSSIAIIDLGIKGLTALVGLIVAGKALSEYRENGRQRKIDFRWKQSQLAKEFIDEMLDDKEAKWASLMLDWDEREYKIGGKVVKVDSNVLKSALRTIHEPFSEEEKVIRDDFDSYFYYIERMEQFLQNGLFENKDIQFPMEYYLNRITQRDLWDIFDNYLKTYHFDNTLIFIKRMKIDRKLK